MFLLFLLNLFIGKNFASKNLIGANPIKTKSNTWRMNYMIFIPLICLLQNERFVLISRLWKKNAIKLKNYENTRPAEQNVHSARRVTFTH